MGGTGTRRLLAAALLATAGAAGLRLAMAAGWFRAPYPDAGVGLAWSLGVPESAYNFGAVEPGRVYRSAEPDERFLRRVVERHGVERLVALSGPSPVHDVARALGLEVEVFAWSASHFPPRDELRRVLGLLTAPGPVWVHCASGADRTGYAVAAWQLARGVRSLEQVRREMAAYGHRAERHPRSHAELEAFAAAPWAPDRPRSPAAVR